MAVLSKTKKIESLIKLLQKRYKGLPAPPERSVLEYLVYAALLENAVFEQADSAFTVLEHYFIDWNEIRVSRVSELADTFSMLPDPQAAGDRVRRCLQGVFERTYSFDLEELKKKGRNLGNAVEFLESLDACTRFMVDYTTQVAFAGHVIPLDEAALRVFRLLGLTQVNKEGTKEEVPGLERAVAKKIGPTFSIQLHHFSALFFNDPDSSEFRTILKQADPEALTRDWTPPALAVPRTSVRKPVIKPPISPIDLDPIIPFVAAEDDFDEDAGGTEAEFLEETDVTLEGASRKSQPEQASNRAGKEKKKKDEKPKKPETPSVAVTKEKTAKEKSTKAVKSDPKANAAKQVTPAKKAAPSPATKAKKAAPKKPAAAPKTAAKTEANKAKPAKSPATKKAAPTPKTVKKASKGKKK